ncbi:Monopolin complex subunit pcs1 [Sphaceloma murrayae]|uniref:Monopolin complex subunit pcs1 n=1 Tax=Sphaceloma murrayae TaxID=2082308 RepID=A0A2K1QRB2_9PEZI|nr:Monopolin complex subunit pcs1 [Sphaceloma murrayae]
MAHYGAQAASIDITIDLIRAAAHVVPHLPASTTALLQQCMDVFQPSEHSYVPVLDTTKALHTTEDCYATRTLLTSIFGTSSNESTNAATTDPPSLRSRTLSWSSVDHNFLKARPQHDRVATLIQAAILSRIREELLRISQDLQTRAFPRALITRTSIRAERELSATNHLISQIERHVAMLSAPFHRRASDTSISLKLRTPVPGTYVGGLDVISEHARTVTAGTCSFPPSGDTTVPQPGQPSDISGDDVSVAASTTSRLRDGYSLERFVQITLGIGGAFPTNGGVAP